MPQVPRPPPANQPQRIDPLKRNVSRNRSSKGSDNEASHLHQPTTRKTTHEPHSVSGYHRPRDRARDPVQRTESPSNHPWDLEAAIASEHYFTAAQGIAYSGSYDHSDMRPAPLDLLTFCVLVLRNGCTVTGESACASPENFDAEIGRKVARENAKQKLWPLLGYALRDQLHSAALKDATWNACEGGNDAA